MRSPLLLLLCLIALAGCRRAESITRGTVTLNGAALEDGYITFLPVEGVAPTRGTEIRAGEYELKNLAPGSWRVVIAPPPRAGVIKTAQGKERVVVWGSASTDGNNQVVTVSADNQTLDFHLRAKPGTR